MRQDDPLRSRKAARWDELERSGVSPDEATRRVEQEFASASPSPPSAPALPAARGPAAAESTRTRTPQLATIKDAGLTFKQEAGGLARSLIRGASYGFGEELESLGALIPGGETQPERLQRIRGEMAEYRKARPGVALGAELTGGLATGLPGLARAAATRGVAGLGARALRGAAGQGALAGAGEAEGGLGARTAGAVTGGVTGGLLGGVLGRGAQAVRTRSARGGPADVGAQFVRELMGQGKLRPGPLRQEAAQMAQIAPETRMADLLGEGGQRAARGQAGLGGEAGQQIGERMRTRYAERPARMQEVLTRSTGKTPENLVETLDEFRAVRKELADPLYAEAYRHPPIVDDAIESLISTRPALRQAERDAQESLANRGIQMPTVDTPEGPVAARTPEYLDYMKRALDDMIYLGRRPGEGGLGRTKLRDLQGLRAEFVERLDNVIPGYSEARAAYAGETALIQAMEEGAEFATKRTKATEVKAATKAFSESEREMFQRGYLDNLRQRIDEDKLKPAELRSPAFADRVTAVFGDKTPAVLDGLSAELRLMQTAGMVEAGSRTAPLAVDIERAAEPATRLGRGLMLGRAAVRDPLALAARSVDLLAEPLSAAARQSRRGARTEALLTSAADVGPLLDRVQRDVLSQRAGQRARQRVGQQAGPRIGRVAGQQLVRGLFAPTVFDEEP